MWAEPSWAGPWQGCARSVQQEGHSQGQREAELAGTSSLAPGVSPVGDGGTAARVGDRRALECLCSCGVL